MSRSRRASPGRIPRSAQPLVEELQRLGYRFAYQNGGHLYYVDPVTGHKARVWGHEGRSTEPRGHHNALAALRRQRRTLRQHQGR